MRQHQAECNRTLVSAGDTLDRASFVFSAAPDRSRPRKPQCDGHRFKRLEDRLGVDAYLHTLRHCAVTDPLTAGVDLRTVAGRLGHGEGSITLRRFAAWVSDADQRAASMRSHRLARSPTVSHLVTAGRLQAGAISRWPHGDA
jgi:site-specific recombinase XerC